LTGDPIVVVVIKVIGVGIAWKALAKLVIATKRRRMVMVEIIMKGGRDVLGGEQWFHFSGVFAIVNRQIL
jgi:hypothetical protein